MKYKNNFKIYIILKDMTKNSRKLFFFSFSPYDKSGFYLDAIRGVMAIIWLLVFLKNSILEKNIYQSTPHPL